MKYVDPEKLKRDQKAREHVTTSQDFNFYRKVSKYDLDRQSVDWSALLKERERQNTFNGKKRESEQGQAVRAKKVDEVVKKMVRINELNGEREAYLKERQVTAKKKQEMLKSMIEEVNKI